MRSSSQGSDFCCATRRVRCAGRRQQQVAENSTPPAPFRRAVVPCRMEVGEKSNGSLVDDDIGCVTVEGWLWKGKASSLGSVFKSTNRRYCKFHDLGTCAVLSCMDDPAGTLLTRVKVFKIRRAGRWFYVTGYNETKERRTELRFKGDFDNDTVEWGDKIENVLLGIESKETIRAPAGSAMAMDAMSLGSEEDESDQLNPLIAASLFPADDELTSETPKRERFLSHRLMDDGNVQDIADTSDGAVTLPSGTGEAGDEQEAEADDDEAGDEGLVCQPCDPEDAAPRKNTAGRWKGAAGKALESAKAAKAHAQASQSRKMQGWGKVKANVDARKKPKKLYGADLLKHIAEQEVVASRVAQSASEGDFGGVSSSREQKARGKGAKPIPCEACRENIEGWYVTSGEHCYHKQCFVCKHCGKSVVGNHYNKKGALYCEEHRAYGNPPCDGCGEPVEGRHVKGPQGKIFHLQCMKCKECDRGIRNYCLHEGNIYCAGDYYRLFAQKCALCKEKIKDKMRILQGSEEAKGLRWHEHCFKCKRCRCKLEKKVYYQDKSLMCERCVKQKLLPNCAKCKEAVEGACINALDGAWHPECFVCTTCNDPLRDFITKDAKPYCRGCYEKEFSKRCAVCNEGISSAFVTALGKTYHDACFKCIQCEKKISGPFLKTPDQQPTCSKDCLAEYYKKVIIPQKIEAQKAKAAAGAEQSVPVEE